MTAKHRFQVDPAELLMRRGGRYASSLGIDLAAADAGERFKWFLAALLFGTRISAALAIRTWKAFATRGVLTPERILQTGWEGLVAILDAGGYVRYDYKTATKLLEVCTSLERDYSGNLDKLHDAAADAHDLQQRIKALGKGVGDTTADIFLRELRGIWVKADPPLSPLALSAAIDLGYLRPGTKPERPLAKLKHIWAEEAQTKVDFAEFEAALVREGLRLRHLGTSHCKPGSPHPPPGKPRDSAR
jgi:hypothetical protein